MKSTSTSACITPQTFSSSSPALILPASRKWNLTGTAEKHSGGLFLWPLSCYILIRPSAPTHRTRVASAAAPRPPSGLWRYNQTFTEHHRSFWDSRIGCTATVLKKLCLTALTPAAVCSQHAFGFREEAATDTGSSSPHLSPTIPQKLPRVVKHKEKSHLHLKTSWSKDCDPWTPSVQRCL